MNPFLTQIVVNTILHKKYKSSKKKKFSRYVLAKGYRELRVTVYSLLKSVLLISLGIASAAFGLESFLLPSSFIDGGATGISLLLSEITSIPLSWLIVIVNVPFLALGYNLIGKEFVIKAVVAIGGLALVLATVKFPEVTNDKLLVSVFGGFFLGAGIGLSVRGGGVLDGTEVLAIYLSRVFGLTIGDVIIGINILIFSAAAYLLSIETALYSLITYLAASKTLDFVIEGIEEYMGVTIVSVHSEEIREMISDELRRGVTVFKAEKGYRPNDIIQETKVVYTVVTRLEMHRLNREIEKIDPNAFVVMSKIKDTKGGMVKKRPLSK